MCCYNDAAFPAVAQLPLDVAYSSISRPGQASCRNRHNPHSVTSALSGLVQSGFNEVAFRVAA